MNPSDKDRLARAIKDVVGRPMATNGWSFWQYDDAGKRVTLEQARAAYLKSRGQ